MEKTITVSEENWKKLTILKINKSFKTIDETIGDLLKNAK